MRKAIIIIPCYNEESRISLKEFSDFIVTHPKIDFCFVNDGSTDKTASLISSFCTSNPERLFFLDLKKNGGKAEAVRQGFLFAEAPKAYEYLGFFDADLSTPLVEIERFLASAESNPQLQLIIGSRIKRLGSNIQRGLKRHILGRIFSTFASITTGIPVYDSQCGAKFFKSDMVADIFKEPFHTKWIFDLEILIRLKNKVGSASFYQITMELPLSTWKEIGGSKLKFKHIISIPFNLFTIYRRYKNS